MKQLDWFARIERVSLTIFVYIIVLGGPPAAVWVADAFLVPKDLSPFIRVSLLIGSGILGFIVFFVVGMALGSTIEDFFSSFRKKVGLKPLRELENQIREDHNNAEFEKEERSRERFFARSDAEQRYSLWELQQRQFEYLKAIRTTVEKILVWLIVFLVFFALTKIF
jgi:hypothetical protein